MNKILKQILILVFLVGILVLPYFVFAEGPLDKLKQTAAGGGYAELGNAPDTAFAAQIGSIVNIFLSLLGIIFIILVIYAGHNWMTAGGNEEKVSKAQSTLTRASIGLAIVIGSYAIWTFIAARLIK